MNNQIFYFFYDMAHRSNLFDHVVIFFAVYFPYIVIFIAGIFLLIHHEVFKAESPMQVLLQKKKEILLAFFTGGLAWIMAEILKLFIHIQRPFIALGNVHPLFRETGYSFPSGHATFFFGLAFALYFSHKKTGYVFLLFALLICIARVTSGVHYPADILGGCILGYIVAFSVAFFVKNV